MMRVNHLSMLLKISADSSKTNLVEVGGITKLDFQLKNNYLDNDSIAHTKWQCLFSSSSSSNVEINGEGEFTNQYSEQLIRRYAFKQEVIFCQIKFENEDHLSGYFAVSYYARLGEYENERFHLTLTSTGKISYISKENDLRAITC